MCRCDERTWRKLLSYLETSSINRKDPGESLERISPVAEQPELKGHQERKPETNMEEVTGAKQSVKELFMRLWGAASKCNLFCSSHFALCCWCFSLCCSLSAQTSPAFFQHLYFYSGSYPKLPLEFSNFKYCPWFTEILQLWMKHSQILRHPTPLGAE